MNSLRILLLLISVLLAAGCTLSPLPPSTPTVARAEVAPDFQLTTLSGEPIRLADLRGRYVLINFWATWCLPCREEMPYLQQLAELHADQLTILGINMRESPAAIQPFVEELHITFPILLQPNDETLLGYGVRGLPLSFLVTPAGDIVLRQVGPLQPETIDLLIPNASQSRLFVPAGE